MKRLMFYFVYLVMFLALARSLPYHGSHEWSNDSDEDNWSEPEYAQYNPHRHHHHHHHHGFGQSGYGRNIGYFYEPPHPTFNSFQQNQFQSEGSANSFIKVPLAPFQRPANVPFQRPTPEPFVPRPPAIPTFSGPQQGSIAPRPQQFPIAPRPQQVPIAPRPQQVPIAPRPQQLPIDPRPQQFPIDSRPQQFPIDSRPQQFPNFVTQPNLEPNILNVVTPANRPVDNINTPRPDTTRATTPTPAPTNKPSQGPVTFPASVPAVVPSAPSAAVPAAVPAPATADSDDEFRIDFRFGAN